MDDMLEDKRRSKGEATRMALLEAALVCKKNLHICEAYVIMRSRLQLPKIVV